MRDQVGVIDYKKFQEAYIFLFGRKSPKTEPEYRNWVVTLNPVFWKGIG